MYFAFYFHGFQGLIPNAKRLVSDSSLDRNFCLFGPNFGWNGFQFLQFTRRRIDLVVVVAGHYSRICYLVRDRKCEEAAFSN